MQQGDLMGVGRLGWYRLYLSWGDCGQAASVLAHQESVSGSDVMPSFPIGVVRTDASPRHVARFQQQHTGTCGSVVSRAKQQHEQQRPCGGIWGGRCWGSHSVPFYAAQDRSEGGGKRLCVQICRVREPLRSVAGINHHVSRVILVYTVTYDRGRPAPVSTSGPGRQRGGAGGVNRSG